MWKYVLRRLLYMALVFMIVSFLTYKVYDLVPGDPVMRFMDGSRSDYKTPEAFQEAYDQLRTEMGLDKPMIYQYGKWLGKFIRGDLGWSLNHKISVNRLIAAPIKNTVVLNLVAMFFVFLITIPLGIRCAVKRGTLFDNTTQVLTIIGYSLPSFIFSILAIFLFAIRLGWVPVGGMGTPNLQGSWWVLLKDRLYYLLLPMGVMVFTSLGGITRYVRSTMIEALREDYIRTARAKGLSQKTVVYSHAFRNAMIPFITIITGWFIGIFGGSVVIETMFAYNGIGKLLFDSLLASDYQVVISLQMFYVSLALLGNLVMDLLYGLADPRVKLA